jgi:3-oxo-5-alpha-steroid 4-dehydrogenase 3
MDILMIESEIKKIPRILHVDCQELLPFLTHTLWICLIVSCIGAVILPEVRRWHRYGKLRETLEHAEHSVFDNLVVPKRWFGLFYVEAMIWSLVLLSNIGNHLIGLSLETTLCAPLTSRIVFHHEELQRFPLSLFLLHCIRRLVEEILNPPSEAKMHVAGFAVGAGFYILAPLAMVQCRVTHQYNLGLLGLGLFIFGFGSIHQTRCHSILRELKNKGNGRYSLPTGDWFEYSSSAHYLAEIVIYVGLILVAFSMSENVPIDLFFCLVFTICNLSVTAQRTHDWYLAKFREDYAKLNRWRIIPLIY